MFFSSTQGSKAGKRKAQCVATQADKVGIPCGNRGISGGQVAIQVSHLEQAASLSPGEGPISVSRQQEAISTRIPGQTLLESTLSPEITASTTLSGTHSSQKTATRLTQASSATASRDQHDQEAIRREAGIYARLFDGQDTWMGKLVQCVQRYPAHVRRLAAIHTLYHLYVPDGHSRPQRPGAWFCHACERIDQERITLSEAVQHWAATDLDYETIAAALQRGERVPGQEGIWEWGRSAAHPSGGRKGTPFQVSMDQQMAERMATRIREEVAIDTYRSQVQIKEGRSPGTWMVLLEWEDGVEVLIENTADWEEYWSGAQECLTIQAKYAQ